MGLVLVVLLAALAIGWLVGGSVRGLGRLRLRHGWLVPAAVASQLLAAYANRPPAGLVVGGCLALAFLAANRRLPGAGLLALGLLANAAVALANGAMPVSVAAAARAGADIDRVLLGQDPGHQVATAGTRLSRLGDIVPVALPVRPEVLSPGDVMVAAGLGELVVTVMGGGLGALPRRRGRPRWQAAAQQRREPHRKRAT